MSVYEVLGKFDSPNFIKVVDSYDIVEKNGDTEVDKNKFMIMEEVQGHSLKHLLKARSIDPYGEQTIHPILSRNQFIKYALKMAKVIQFLNTTAGIIHSNISPSNWMIHSTGSLILHGFSKAKLLSKTAIWTGKLPALRTDISSLHETLQWMKKQTEQAYEMDAGKMNVYHSVVNVYG